MLVDAKKRSCLEWLIGIRVRMELKKVCLGVSLEPFEGLLESLWSSWGPSWELLGGT